VTAVHAVSEQPPRLLIVTRPAGQAAAWVRDLRGLGCSAQALPLIAIAPAADSQPVLATWQRLQEFALLMFVSANAVKHFFALRPSGCAWPGALRAGATGPGTAAALLAAAVPASAIVQPAADAENFDSEALWAQLAPEPWAGRRVLVVRGEDGRDWLADAWQKQGAQVEFVAAYQRQVPTLSSDEQDLLRQAQAQPAAHLWLFSSSQAVAHLRLLAPRADWQCSAALASHPRIAQAARTVGFGMVSVAAPSVSAVVQCLRQWPPIQSAAL
jgi:uroporphyrinogen-III synthase